MTRFFPPVRRWALPAAMLAAFVASRVLASRSGMIYDISPITYAWQIVDPVHLQARPLESLWYLHTQPPLFNAFLAAGLAVPLDTAVTFRILFSAMGLGIMALMHDLAVRLGVPRRVAAALAVLFIVSPGALLYEHWLFYEYPLVLLLLATFDLFHRYASTGRVRPLAGLAAAGGALVLTRSLFHPVWLVLLFLAAALAHRPRTGWRVAAAIAGVPLGLVAVLVVKNAVLFHSPSLSSWFGMNLSRTTNEQIAGGERDALVTSGAISRYAESLPFQPYAGYEALGPPCTPAHPDIPVLAEPTAPRGSVNFNYECYLPIYAAEQHDGLVILRRYPRRVLAGQLASYEIFFKAASDYVFLEPQRAHIEGYARWYRTWVEWAVPWDNPRPEGLRRDQTGLNDLHISLLAVAACAAAAAAGVLGVWRWRRHGMNAVRATAAAAGLTTVLLTVAANAFEIGENNRFRFTIEPLTLVLLAACVTWLVRWTRLRYAPRAAVGDPDGTA